ncbi:MAG: hypothetical protein GY757_39685, partial [bacterium]|nr:hypothetical protein [bacterium]
DGKVTEDGKKMAEFPVSLRSARMLLEAHKGNPRVVDSAIKCIAALETRGIINKEFASEKYTNHAFNSDFLNQLALWGGHLRNRKAVNWKRFQMAKEIYKELNKRLGIKSPPKGGLSSKDLPVLYRAILSCFADEVNIISGGEYIRENEIRKLDRSSVLFESKPEMLVGYPFDLVFTRENKDTGDKEETYVPLITFASEFTLELLEHLKPFSYYKEETVKIEGTKITVYREIYFGGRMIKNFTSPPVWDDADERNLVVTEVMKWYENNKEKFDIDKKIEEVETSFNEIGSIVKSKLKPFDFYKDAYFKRELDEQLRMDDLNLFFKFHSGFTNFHLQKFLPHAVIKELKKARWPQSHDVCGESFTILYTRNKGGPSTRSRQPQGVFIKFDYQFFEKVREQELILPTGERAGVILGNKRYLKWEHAVAEYNRWKKNDIFEKKLKNSKKPGHMEDLQKLPFPQAFEGGKGKDNTPFEYYIVPKVEEDEVFLVHFIEKENAGVYFESIRPQWEEYIRKYKKSKIDNIFKQKGWTVR